MRNVYKYKINRIILITIIKLLLYSIKDARDNEIS